MTVTVVPTSVVKGLLGKIVGVGKAVRAGLTLERDMESALKVLGLS